MFIETFLFRVHADKILALLHDWSSECEYSKTVSMTAEDRAVAEKIKNSSEHEIIQRNL